MARLMVDIESLGWLRQRRGGRTPDPVAAATALETAGVHGITCPLTGKAEDPARRDAQLLLEIMNSHLNLELRPAESTVRAALKLTPPLVTLVAPYKSSTYRNNPLTLQGDTGELVKWIGQLRANKIVVSCWIQPTLDNVKTAASISADYVEFNTADYSAAEDATAEQAALDSLAELAVAANRLGLGVMAGHGLTYDNAAGIARIPHMETLHIGHAIISRGMLIGIGQAVRDMIDVMHRD